MTKQGVDCEPRLSTPNRLRRLLVVPFGVLTASATITLAGCSERDIPDKIVEMEKYGFSELSLVEKDRGTTREHYVGTYQECEIEIFYLTPGTVAISATRIDTKEPAFVPPVPTLEEAATMLIDSRFCEDDTQLGPRSPNITPA